MKRFLDDWAGFEKALLIVSTIITISMSIVWKDSFIGIISAVAGIISVILCAKGKSSNYLFGLLYTVTFIYIAYQNKFYGQVMVNTLYYVPMNILGYIMWNKSKDNSDDDIETVSMSQKGIIITAIVAVVSTLLYSLILNKLSGNLTIMDSAVTILSIIALYLQTKRYTETWIMWFLYNVASCSLWVIAVVSGTSTSITMLIMNVTYLVNSIYGFYNWKKLEKTNA